jgi:hypothetical protein
VGKQGQTCTLACADYGSHSFQNAAHTQRVAGREQDLEDVRLLELDNEEAKREV